MNTAQREKQAATIGTIDSLLESLSASRTKSAAANTEPGSIGGATTHPVKDVDDGTEAAREGSRSAENHKDVKEDQPGAGVDNTSPGTPGGQDSVQMNVGITSKATGEDSANETSSAKGGKDDPGSSHPARTDNDSLDGSKYSSIHEELQALLKQSSAIGNAMLASIAAQGHETTKKASPAAAPAVQPPAAPVAKKEAAVDPAAEAQAGFDLAGAVADNTMVDKQAMDAFVLDKLAETWLSGQALATKVAKCIGTYNAGRAKRAESDSGDSDDGDSDDEGGGGGSPFGGKSDEGSAGGGDGGGHSAPPAGGGGGDPAGGGHPHDGGGAPGGGAPGGDPMGGGGGGQNDMAMLQALLGGGQGMGGGDAVQGMAGGGGGAPGGAPMGGGMGGDPMGGGGAMGGDPMGGGGGGDQQAMLMQILQQAGITPEQLQGLLGQKQAELRAKQAHWAPKTAADQKKYAHMKSVIAELVGRRI